MSLTRLLDWGARVFGAASATIGSFGERLDGSSLILVGAIGLDRLKVLCGDGPAKVRDEV